MKPSRCPAKDKKARKVKEEWRGESEKSKSRLLCHFEPPPAPQKKNIIQARNFWVDTTGKLFMLPTSWPRWFPWTKNCYRWFPLISGHGTKKLLSMGFEIIGLATSTCNRYHSKVKDNDRKIVKCSECGLMQLKSKCHSKVTASILTITDKETMSLIIIDDIIKQLYT